MITIEKSLPHHAWRQYVEQHPRSNIYQTPEMFEVFRQTHGYRPEIWAALHNGEVLALLLPVQVTVSKWLPRFLNTRAVVYGGILCNQDALGREALGLLLKTYTREVKGAPLFTEVRNMFMMDDLRPVFEGAGFHYEEHLNFIIDISLGVDGVFQNISKRGRKTIRRSIRKGVEAVEVEDRALVRTVYDLFRQTYDRARVPMADLSMFEAVYDILVPKGMAKMYLAQADGQYMAATLEAPYRQKDAIYGWFSGFDLSFGKYYPNDRLMWHILEWGASQGYRFYDFGGGGRPDEEYGPRDFKAKYGGQIVNYGRFTYVHNPLVLSVSRQAYQLFRKILPLLRRESRAPMLEETDDSAE